LRAHRQAANFGHDVKAESDAGAMRTLNRLTNDGLTIRRCGLDAVGVELVDDGEELFVAVADVGAENRVVSRRASDELAHPPAPSSAAV